MPLRRRSAPVLLFLSALAFGPASFASDEEPPRLDRGAAAVGAGTFRNYCASCHGGEARGDGPLAEHMRVHPSDLTLLSKANSGVFPFDVVVSVIDGRKGVKGHGSAEMPAWGDAFKKTSEAPDEAAVRRKIEELAHFIWSLQLQAG
jgi:mono/diheme cytochrome c family protein